MTDFEALLTRVAGRAPLPGLADAMAQTLPRYGITTPLRIAHFVGQACEESAAFQTLHEYGGTAYFARYDGRTDLGNTQPGDGARYKGRGILQITGRANYARAGQALGLDLVGHPELAETPAVAVETACLYWRDHGLNAAADIDDIVRITRRINGGLTGFAQRKVYVGLAKAALATIPAVQPPPPRLTAAAPVADVVVAPQPDAPVEPALAPETDPQPVDTNGDPVDITGKLKLAIGSVGRGGLAAIGGFLAAAATYLRAHPFEAVLLGALAIVAFLVFARWVAGHTERQHAHEQRLLAATPAVPLPIITPAEIAAALRAVAALRSA